MVTVLVVDDEPQVRNALRRALESQGDQVLSARNGQEAIDLAAAQTPDLVVLDLWLPDLDGVEVVTRLRSWLDAPILILSGEVDERRKVQALDAGADDFLQKPFGFSELAARLRALKRRSVREETGQRMVFGDLVVDLPQRAVFVEREPVKLTPTEWGLLEALATRPGKLLTHGWLLAQVWGAGHGDESRQSLRTHIRSLRAKIGDDAADPRYVRTESGAGYRWLLEPDGPRPPAATAPAAPTGGEDGEDGGDLVIGADGQPIGRTAGADRLDGGDEESVRWFMHELNNVLTAMNLALHVSRRAGADTATTQEALQGHLQRTAHLVNRAAELVGRLSAVLEREQVGRR